MPTKPILAIDHDDVLFDLNRSLAEYHNSRFGTNVDHDAVRSWYLHDVYGCTAEEMLTRIDEFHRDSATDIPPLPGAVKAIQQLHEWYNLIVITARDNEHEPMTMRSLGKYYPGLFQEVYHTNHQPKSRICMAHGAVALVDDGMHNAEEAATAGLRVYMPDRPWNQEYTPKGVIRTHSWDELIQHLQPAR